MANFIDQGTRRSFQAIRVVGSLYDRRASNWLEATYFPTGDNGQKEVYPGLIVAQNTGTYKWVPYSATATYGPGSDGTNSVLGILDTFEDVSWGDQSVAPLFHGRIIERHCYVLGGQIGTVSSTIKSKLPDVDWV